jgi:serine/threonine-protein kinase
MSNFFRAAAAWILVAVIGFIITDLLIMPSIAGHFKGTVTTPDVMGLLPEEAEKRLKECSLIFMMDSAGQFSPDIEAGLILNQRPSANTKVKKGRRVWVTISKGLKSIKLPEMKGSSVRQAEISLQQLNLKMGRILRVTNPKIPSGVVFKTNPPVGSVIEVNSQVALFVSSGKQIKSDAVRNMMGLPLHRAKAWIRSAKMEVGTIKYQVETSVLPNTVLDQNPKAGTPIVEGKAVDLVVTKK